MFEQNNQYIINTTDNPDSKENEASMRDFACDYNRVTLVHNSIMELIATHSPELDSIYPIANRMQSLIQKPMMIVILPNVMKIDEIIENKSWIHNLKHPKELCKYADSKIEEALRSEKERIIHYTRKKGIYSFSDWLLKVNRKNSGFNGIGFFYVNYFFNSNYTINPKKTKINKLYKKDMNSFNMLYMSMRRHDKSSEYFSDNWAKVANDSIKMQENKFELAKLDISSQEIYSIFNPVLESLDILYLSLRGGSAGVFDKDVGKSGARLLWARHKEVEQVGGVRPPTFWFFVKLRAPTGNGYRICPLITKSMNLDSAFILKHYWNKKSSKKNGDQEIIVNFLKKLGIEKPKTLMLESFELLAESLNKVTRIDNFIERRAFSSMTSIAFQSGFNMSINCEETSIIDELAFGPRLVAFEMEHQRLVKRYKKEKVNRNYDKEMAFTKPIMVSGRPYITAMTKSYTPVLHDTEINFENFYYNFVFQQGLLARKFSRNIRRSIRDACLFRITSGFYLGVKKYSVVDTNQKKLIIYPSAAVEINRSFDKVAMVFPYGKVKISFHSDDSSKKAMNSKGQIGSNEFKLIKGVYVHFKVDTNPYYSKLISYDFINNKYLLKAFIKARIQLLEHWNYI